MMSPPDVRLTRRVRAAGTYCQARLDLTRSPTLLAPSSQQVACLARG